MAPSSQPPASSLASKTSTSPPMRKKAHLTTIPVEIRFRIYDFLAFDCVLTLPHKQLKDIVFEERRARYSNGSWETLWRRIDPLTLAYPYFEDELGKWVLPKYDLPKWWCLDRSFDPALTVFNMTFHTEKLASQYWKGEFWFRDLILEKHLRHLRLTVCKGTLPLGSLGNLFEELKHLKKLDTLELDMERDLTDWDQNWLLALFWAALDLCGVPYTEVECACGKCKEKAPALLWRYKKGGKGHWMEIVHKNMLQ